MSNINAVSFRENEQGWAVRYSPTHLVRTRQNFIARAKEAPSILETLKVGKETGVEPQDLDEKTHLREDEMGKCPTLPNEPFQGP